MQTTDNSSPAISIIIPSRNQGQFLEETIQSLLCQEYPGLECIIIDGASSDNSLEIIEKYKSSLAFHISEPDSGQSDALNRGFARARGEIFGWLNSDDTLQPGSLAEVAAAFTNNDIQIAMASHYRIIDADSTLCQIRENRYSNRQRLIRYWRDQGMTINQPSVFFRAELFHRVNASFALDLQYAMDYDLWLQLTRSADIITVPGCWANYRVHGASKTGTGFRNFIPEWNRVSRKYLGSWLTPQPYCHWMDFFLCLAENCGKEGALLPDTAHTSTTLSNLTVSKAPLVSVLISNYNYGHFLSTAINSVLNQTYHNLELIVVDDGSLDGSREILDQYRDTITVIFQENRGQAAAFNAGFKKCHGEIICFLDADDYWQDNKVMETVAAFHRQKRGMVFHDLFMDQELRTDRGTAAVPRLYSNLKKNALIGGSLYPDFLTTSAAVNFMPTSAMAISKQVAEQIFPLHEQGWKICADTQIACCAACFAPIGIINKPLGSYRLHSGNCYSNEQVAQSEHTRVLDLINKKLCQLKLNELAGGTIENPPSPMSNYLVLRRWLFMTAPLNLQLLRELFRANTDYFTSNKHVYYRKTARIKFICLDIAVTAALLARIPCKKQRLRALYFSQFAADYTDILAEKPDGRDSDHG